MDEQAFLDGYDPTAYERPSVAVDLVLLGLAPDGLVALLLRRDQPPFAGRLALPGSFAGITEALDDAARRVLRAKAGIAHAHLEQLYTFGTPDRDPRMRIVSVAYLALLAPDAFAAARRDNPALVATPLPAEDILAFDHAEILALAQQRLRGKLDYSDVAFALLPACFTLRQLQAVHEAILGHALNKPAFRRRMIDRGWLEPTGRREANTSYRPAELFRYRPQP